MEAQRGKTQKRKSQRESERKEGGKERERGEEKTAPLHKTTAVKNKHSRLI